MPNKPTDLKPKTGGTVVLRDESDEIIDTLKNQLSSLQEQLDAYKVSENQPSKEQIENAELLAGWNQQLTPHLASRLQVPAEELAHRLDRLIDQVGDPELREELERCRDLAFFFYETFHKISNNHRLLTESLTAPKMEVDMADFCRVMEYPIPKQSMPFPVEKLPGLPKRIFFASRAAATVMQALAELATNLFGKDLRIEVSNSPAREEGAQNQLALRIYSDGAGEEAAEGEEVSVFALRRGVTANTVVDLLYVEKIVELQGGRFAFDRREGKVFGFRIHLPYDIPSS